MTWTAPSFETIDKASGQLSDSEQLIRALVKLAESLEICEEGSGMLTGVAYAALEKIETAIELIDPAKPRVI